MYNYNVLSFIRNDKDQTWNLKRGIKQLNVLGTDLCLYGPYEVLYTDEVSHERAKEKLLNSIITTLLSEIDDIKDCLS